MVEIRRVVVPAPSGAAPEGYWRRVVISHRCYYARAGTRANCVRAKIAWCNPLIPDTGIFFLVKLAAVRRSKRDVRQIRVY